MTSLAFARMATTTFSTKRNSTSNGRTTLAATSLAAVLGTPPMPVTTEILDMYRIQSPRQHYVIYFEGAPDIVEGDLVTFNSEDMPVRGVGAWPTDQSFLEVIVEAIK